MGGGGEDAVVSARGLRKVHGEGAAAREALSGVDLEIRRGEFTCVLGPSGSGKSTLLGIMGGLDRAYSGSVALFGQELAGLGDAELAALRGQRVGFVFQAFHLLPHLSVLDNVTMPALFARPAPSSGSSSRARRASPEGAAGDAGAAEARGRELLRRLGLEDRRGARVAELSGGQRQRVAIARALLHEPELLLCDEPTGNLDDVTGAEIVALFEELHRSVGLTIVAVTHEARLAEAASRILHLRAGKLEEAGNVEGAGPGKRDAGPAAKRGRAP